MAHCTVFDSHDNKFCLMLHFNNKITLSKICTEWSYLITYDSALVTVCVPKCICDWICENGTYIIAFPFQVFDNP